eukprot:6490029-Amphidinium_carterae.1
MEPSFDRVIVCQKVCTCDAAAGRQRRAGGVDGSYASTCRVCARQQDMPRPRIKNTERYDHRKFRTRSLTCLFLNTAVVSKLQALELWFQQWSTWEKCIAGDSCPRGNGQSDSPCIPFHNGIAFLAAVPRLTPLVDSMIDEFLHAQQNVSKHSFQATFLLTRGPTKSAQASTSFA